ncbi:hypothetical protein [Streptomyces tendae]|uniref:hypothetical protein n=1 Tax=Streptomyces tendae TaxID=1932 RepID=UPI00342CA4AB
MDPAVTAAVIAVPTAVVAAAAAYAGARSQARSAHRGPVDAVRRQHQRDAYAAFLAACQAYGAATAWDACYQRATADALASGTAPGPGFMDLVAERARHLILAVSLDEMLRTGAVVDLEGPEHISAGVNITVGLARQFRSVAHSPMSSVTDSSNLISAYNQFVAASQVFLRAARAHLNSVDG